MNPWREIACVGCDRVVRFDPDTLILDPHQRYPVIMPLLPCPRGGEPVASSRLPGWHPEHEHGVYCDGADHVGQALLFSDCWREHMDGPPGAVDALADVADG